MAAVALVVQHVRFVLPFLLLAVASATYDDAGQQTISRGSFPEGFVFGTASSSYQVSTSLSIGVSFTGCTAQLS
jgi:hypothetical protein